MSKRFINKPKIALLVLLLASVGAVSFCFAIYFRAKNDIMEEAKEFNPSLTLDFESFSPSITLVFKVNGDSELNRAYWRMFSEEKVLFEK